MDVGNIAQWGSMLISCLALAYAIISAASRARSDRVAQLEARLAATERLVERIQGDLEHIPSRDAFHSMAINLERMQGQIGLLNERIKPVSAISERLQDLFLEQARDSQQRRSA